MKELNFKSFLLNENRGYLGEKIGDILSSLQELNSNSKVIGTRDLVKFCETIVSQIRAVLRSNWNRDDFENLKKLQKIAVALMNGINKKSDLADVLNIATKAMEKLSQDLGVPVQKFVNTEKEEPKSNVAKPIKSNINAMSGEPKSQVFEPNVQADAPSPSTLTGPAITSYIS